MKKTTIIKQSLSTITLKKGKIIEDITYSTPNDLIKNFYVYFVFYNLELIYIGKGKGDRWKHTFSMGTHSPFIRQAIKQSKASDYKNTALYKTYIIRDGLHESNALWIEEKYIKQFTPFGNIDLNPSYMSKKGYWKLCKNLEKLSDIKNPTAKATKASIKRCKKRMNRPISKQTEQEIHDMTLIYTSPI